MLEQVVLLTITPLLGGIVAYVVARLRSNSALKMCQEAKEACNDELHALKASLTTAQARIVALELEFDRRLRALEPYRGRYQGQNS